MMDKLIQQLKRHEGLRLKPYKCTAGKTTIGYGRNLDDVGISVAEAEYMLHDDIVGVRDALARLDWFNGLSLMSARYDCIVNMAFNMGVAGLLNFKNMISAIESGNYDLAADEMLDSKWAKQVGNRAVELSQQMRTGKYE